MSAQIQQIWPLRLTISHNPTQFFRCLVLTPPRIKYLGGGWLARHCAALQANTIAGPYNDELIEHRTSNVGLVKRQGAAGRGPRWNKLDFLRFTFVPFMRQQNGGIRRRRKGIASGLSVGKYDGVLALLVLQPLRRPRCIAPGFQGLRLEVWMQVATLHSHLWEHRGDGGSSSASSKALRPSESASGVRVSGMGAFWV